MRLALKTFTTTQMSKNENGKARIQRQQYIKNHIKEGEEANEQQQAGKKLMVSNQIDLE